MFMIALQVSRFCSLAMSCVDKMLRPIGPTLCFPIEIDEAVDEKRVHFSETNQFINIRPEPIFASTKPEKLDEVNETPSTAVLAVNPLLEDVEMSEFDFLDQPPLVVENTREAEDKIVQIEGGKIENVPEPDSSAEKRKNSVPSEDSPKKSKLDVRTTLPQASPEMTSFKEATSNLTTEPAGSSVETPLTQEIEDAAVVAENELEEEMLNSFVDEVV
ncbi:unnamed protein product [Nesidiocoris tenuis]|uniref:Uncharacterized protein n=1 Tax=Nesidiocoris tenuis TaxID=355587 RepID=A0A6H5HJH2_9HEMI|nr:unnamed protein product [Nesidiocoris tenuis]